MKKSLVAAGLAALVAVGSPAVAQATGAVTAEESTAGQARFSGEELFDAIYFGAGPAASSIPEVEEVLADADNTSPETEELRETLIAEVDAQDPEFFDQFQEELISGDHSRVSDAMDDGLNALGAAFEAEFPEEWNAADEVTPKACTAVLACVTTIVLAVNWGGGVNVAVVAVVYVEAVGPDSANAENELLHQQVIDRIANDLAVAA